MFKISKKADYALIALTHLSMSNRKVSAKEIADYYNFSSQMMSKVMKDLAIAGYLSGYRGTSGGYQLVIDPNSVSLGDVLKAIDGPMAIVDCVESNYGCPAINSCLTHKMLIKVQKDIQSLIDNISLHELITDKNNKRIKHELN